MDEATVGYHIASNKKCPAQMRSFLSPPLPRGLIPILIVLDSTAHARCREVADALGWCQLATLCFSQHLQHSRFGHTAWQTQQKLLAKVYPGSCLNFLTPFPSVGTEVRSIKKMLVETQALSLQEFGRYVGALASTSFQCSPGMELSGVHTPCSCTSGLPLRSSYLLSMTVM